MLHVARRTRPAALSPAIVTRHLLGHDPGRAESGTGRVVRDQPGLISSRHPALPSGEEVRAPL
ncbi:hypothetical protein [Streptomyces atratus]|uniref:hypothetical protein n=1 Tax=Streptomyces atratus TaxID=1893 RepID=UPI00224D717C|nr:hypothetical protein [Streptomyces atratus]MCX5338859.1 hypothetical protein [Streptomyces atratus]